MRRLWLPGCVLVLMGAIGCSESSDGAAADPGDTSDAGAGGNQAPEAVSFSISVRADTPREIVLQGRDPNGDALQYTLTSDPYQGLLSGTGDTFIYTPEPGVLGTDSFSYSVSDGVLGSEYDGYVWININEASANEPPQPGDLTVFTSPNQPASANVLTYDEDGDTLTYRIIDGPQHGTSSIDGTVVTYTPNQDWVGTDLLHYGVDDGSGEVVGWVSFVVTPPPTFGAMSEDERMAAMDQLSAKMAELPSLASLSELQTVESFARTVPGVAVVGSNPEAVWGQFTDGAPFIIGVDAMPGATQPAIAPQPAAPAVKGGSPTPAGRVDLKRADSGQVVMTATLPPGRRAVLFTGFGPSGWYGEDPSPKLKSMLDNARYQTEIIDASLVNYQHFGSLGDPISVIHLRTHGGVGYLYEATKSPDYVEGIWSTTVVSSTLSSGYKADIDAGRVVFMNETIDKTTRRWQYGISPEFIEKYWTNVHPGAYVHASSCWLGLHKEYDPTSGKKYQPPVSPLQQVFVDRQMLFGGWTKAVEVAHADKAALFVFDRMLGANTTAPLESPPQRPMGASSIKRNMTSKGLDVNSNPAGAAVFRFFGPRRGADFRTNRLAPSIKTMTADIDKNKLVVEGDFEVNGAVDQNNMRIAVGDTLYPVETFDYKSVTCELPAKASGDVRVVVEERESPRVRLSSWNGTLTYSVSGPGSLRQEWTFKVNLVGSAHKYRDRAGDAPAAHNGYVTMWATGSSGQYEVSGSFAGSSTRIDWSGGGSLTPYTSSATSPPDGSFALFGQMAAAAPDKLWWNVIVNLAAGGGATQKVYYLNDDKWELQSTVSIGSVFPFSSGFLDSTSGISTGPFALKVPAAIGPDGTLQAGQIGPEELQTCSACGLVDEPFYHHFSWDTMAPAGGTEVDPEMAR